MYGPLAAIRLRASPRHRERRPPASALILTASPRDDAGQVKLPDGDRVLPQGQAGADGARADEADDERDLER